MVVSADRLCYKMDPSNLESGPVERLDSRIQTVAIAVFPKEDSLLRGIRSGAEELNWKFISFPDLSFSSPTSAIHLILLDYRQSHLLPPNTLDVIQSLKSRKHVLSVVAYVKKSFFDKDEMVISPLLEMGIDRVEIDHGLTSTSFWMNELNQMKRTFVDPALELIESSTLVTALDNCRDIVQITDSSHRIQFVNEAYERLLGYSREEVVGKNCNILQNPDVHPQTVQKIGSSTLYKRKTGEFVNLNSRVIPFNSQSPTQLQRNSDQSDSPTTHYIYISDECKSRPPALHPAPAPATSAAVKYVRHRSVDHSTSNAELGFHHLPHLNPRAFMRKASYDVNKSIDHSSVRRQSLARIHSHTLGIEAPITRVINIIASAQQNCPAYIAEALEKVLEILRTTELYSPKFFEPNSRIKSDDPLTTDLLGALLSQGRKPPPVLRRPSAETLSRRHLMPRPSLPDISEKPTALHQLLETEAEWDFNIILLEEITERRPLVWAGMAIFSRFGVAQSLNTDEVTLRNWLTLIEANYHSANPYHNSTHAADVLQATAYFLSTERLKTFFDPLDEAVSLIAAAVHDVDHPGKNSAFLVNSANDLALLYNDLSVLESHHSAFTFKLTLSDTRVNILKNLDSATFKTFRTSLVDMVLATEMTKHFEHFAKFVNVFTKPFINGNEVGEISMDPASEYDTEDSFEPDISTLITSENIILIKRMLIKCADVSNPTRPWPLCAEWAKRIAEEYFQQTDEEISRKLPPVMPMFERNSCSIPKSQTGFIDYFIVDMYDAWDAFLGIPEIADNIKINYECWRELERRGIHSASQLDVFNSTKGKSSSLT